MPTNDPIRDPDVSQIKYTSLALYKALSAQPLRTTIDDRLLELLRTREMPENLYGFVHACAHHEVSKANVGDWDLTGRYAGNVCPSVYEDRSGTEWIGAFDFGLEVGRSWGGDTYLALESAGKWRFHRVPHQASDEVETFKSIDGIVMTTDEEGSDIEKYMMM